MENFMNKEQASGKFDQLKAEFKKTWGKLTDNDMMLYQGKREEFLGKLKEHYGIAKEEAETKIKAMEDACRCDSTKAA
jgi:uncharacterized protein YjbJ (UPF0337 family)